MGYLISSHIVKADADLDKLKDLPEEISFRAYQQDGLDYIFIDFFPANKIPKYPFQRIAPSTGIPLEFSEQHEILNTLYKNLKACGAANSFKRAIANFNRKVSKLLDTEVLSIASDDDDLDFAVRSSSGNFLSINFRADDLDINYINGQVTLQPLITEESEPLIDLSSIESDNFIIKERDKEFSTLLHDVAAKAVTSFIGSTDTILGLSSFDPPEIEYKMAYEFIHPSEPKQHGAAQPTVTKPWWKFWSK